MKHRVILDVITGATDIRNVQIPDYEFVDEEESEEDSDMDSDSDEEETEEQED